MIRITAKRDGFRRCGVAHPARPTDHPDDRFTEEQLAVMQAEPGLVVVILPDSVDESDPTVKTPAKGTRK